MATYRGTDGNLKIATNSVANIISWSLEVARDVLDTTAMQATAKTKTLDLPDARGRATCRLDGADTAQAAMIAQMIAGAVPSVLAFKFIVTGATKEFTGNLLVASGTISGQQGQLFDIEFAFEVDGAVGMTWS